MNIILIGYRGTGKTTVAERLARRLGWPAVDADVLIEERAGRTIAEVFADQGEQAFRDLESKIVAELASRDRHVLALGGGAVLRQKNRRAIARAGKVVWLRAGCETIHRRMTGDATTRQRRPKLTRTGGLAEIRNLLAQRTPIYRECADYQVDTEEKTPDQIADEILSTLGLEDLDRHGA